MSRRSSIFSRRWVRHLIPYEQHHRFDRIHEARRYQSILFEVRADAERDDQEHGDRDDPQHQDVFADGHVDSENVGQMDQGMFGIAVGDMLNDDVPNVKSLVFGFLDRFFLNA